MASVTNDKLTKSMESSNPIVTTVSSSRSIGATALICDALDDWPTETAIYFVTYKKKTDGTKDFTTQASWKAVVSGTTLGSLTLISGTDAGNAIGDYVEMGPTAGWGEGIYAFGIEEHATDGTHDATKVGMLAGTQTFTGDKTFTGALALPAGTTIGSNPSGSGAWTSWTPSFDNWTIGSGGSAGTVARYIQIGKTVHYYIKSTLGTSGQSAGTAPDFSLPVAANTNWGANAVLGHLVIDPTGSGACPGQVLLVSGKGRLLAFLDDSGTASAYVALDNVAASAPGTWVAGGYFVATGTYEAA